MSVEAASEWRDRLVSAEEAVSVVRAGDKVFVGSACATPRSLVGALERLGRPGVVLVHFLTDRVGTGDPPRTRYRHRVFYVGRDVRALGQSGWVDYLPLSLADVPKLFRNGQIPLDVAMIQVAPPDPDGTCSLGISVDVTKAAALTARTVIAEVNPAMPRTAGDSRIPVSRIARFVAVETPVVEYLHDPVGEAAAQIARYVARLIDDRSTLQVGLGRVPNQMLTHLTNRRGLAIHSDMITEPVVGLVDAGVITGPVVTSWAMGTRRLYDLVDDDPRFAFHPVEYVCDPASHRGQRADGVRHAGVRRRPHRPGVHRNPRWRAVRRGLHRARPSTVVRSPPRAAWPSSASPRAHPRAGPRSASTWVPPRPSRSHGPTCIG